MSRVGDSTHGIEASQDHDDKEKREERREEKEERRKKREKGRDKREDRIQTPRGRQRSPDEAARGGPTLFLAMPLPGGTVGGFKGRGKRAEKREKREETRENFFLVFRKVRKGSFPRIA